MKGGFYIMADTPYKVTLAHAVGDENSKSSGGKAGDQKQNQDNAKGEVLFQDWYISGKKKWDCVLRCKNDYMRSLIAEDAIKAVRNGNIGYDQNERYTLYDNVKNQAFDCKSVDKPVECDCSSLATVCVNYAGIPIPKDTCTSNMQTRYSNTKLFKVYTSNEYVKDYAKLSVGDILVRAGYHTAIVANTLYHFTRQLKLNDTLMTGGDVKALQYRLNELGIPDAPLVVDGELGKKTDSAIRKFQKGLSLEVDGIVGPKTAVALGFLYC